MSLPILPSDAGLLLLQAGIVASPRPLGNTLRERVQRLRGPAWALIPVVSMAPYRGLAALGGLSYNSTLAYLSSPDLG